MTCSSRICLISFLVLIASPFLAAQATPEASKQRHFSEMKAVEQYVAYWTTEPGWRTELQLRNNLEAADLTVTPALRTADGTEASLAPITIKPGDVESVDVTDAILKGVPKLVGSYGSLVLRYQATVDRALQGSVMLMMEGRPIAFHLDASFHNDDPGRASREGIWWLPRASVNDFLILSNAGKEKLAGKLTLYDSAGKAARQTVSLEPRQTQRVSIRSLLQHSGLGGTFGGFRIDGVDTGRFLDSAYLLVDEFGGFSAEMKMFHHDPDTPLSSHLFGGMKEWTNELPCWR